MTGFRLCTASAVLLFTQIITTPLVVAQTQDSGDSLNTSEQTGTLSVVVVTARKQTERLQDVPISIQVVSGDALRSRAVINMAGLAPSVPDFRYSDAPAATDSYYIRGIGTAPNFGFEPAVGLVIDGFYYDKTAIGRAAFLDLDRIEVLKGPQGANLEMNNTAGAINITTAKPTNTFQGMASASGNFTGNDGYSGEGYLSGPITDTLKVRVAARYDAYNGWYTNLAFNGRHEPQIENETARAILEWTPTSALTVTATFQQVSNKQYGTPRELIWCGPGRLSTLGYPGLPSDDCLSNFIKSTYGVGLNGLPARDLDTVLLDMAHLVAQWDIGRATLTSRTGYMRYRTSNNFDGDNTPYPGSQVYIPEEYNELQEELRLNGSLGRFDYTAGTFLRWNHNPAQFHFILPSAGLDDVEDSHESDNTQAVFGLLTYHLTHSIDFSVGGRYTHLTKNLSQNSFFDTAFTGTFVSPLYDINRQRTENNFSPSLDVRWHLAANTMLYGSIHRGFKGGGFDRFLFVPTQTEAEANVEFSDEKVTAYELGMKFESPENNLRLDVALFRADYTDLQVSDFVTAQEFRVENAAGALTQGVEGTLDWLPVRHLTLGLNLAYLDAHYVNFPHAPCYTDQTTAEGCGAGTLGQDLTGRRLSFAPPYSASLNANYSWLLSRNLEVDLFGEWSQTGHEQTGDGNPYGVQPAYGLLSAHVSVSDVAKRWEISLFGRNLTNKVIRTTIENSSPDALDSYEMAPRVVGMSGTVYF